MQIALFSEPKARKKQKTTSSKNLQVDAVTCGVLFIVDFPFFLTQNRLFNWVWTLGKLVQNKLNALRYLRHIDLPEMGFDGQEKISSASALLVGMGGLGAAAALYLCAGGMGRLGLVDDDRVEESNLQRQVIFSMDDIGAYKTQAAAKKLSALNPSCQLDVHTLRFDESNATTLIKHYAIILDCSDNFKTRFLLNQVCVAAGKTLVSASVQGFKGQMGVFRPGHACYRCLFPETPPEGMVPTCPEAGVFGPIVGIMGVMQASDTLKECAGLNDKTETQFFSFDSLHGKAQTLAVAKNPECATCAQVRPAQAGLSL